MATNSLDNDPGSASGAGTTGLDSCWDNPSQSVAAPTPARYSNRVDLLVALAAGLSLGGAGVLWRMDRSATAELRKRLDRAPSVAADAARIRELAGQPKAVGETGPSETWLLAQANEAMRAVGLEPSRLVSSAPQPARPVPNSELSEVCQTLVFEDVSLETIARFCASLSKASPALRTASLDLRPRPDAKTWNADVEIAYRVLRTRANRPDQSNALP